MLIALIGLIPAAIARAKGHSFIDRWIYGSTLFICALLHSLLLKSDAKEIESRQLFFGNTRKCPFCTEVIKAEAVVCSYRGLDLVQRLQIAAAFGRNNLG